MKLNKSIQFRDFSRGTIRTVQSSIVPQNSFKLALNLDSDKELGSLITRLGTGIVGVQAVASATCYGMAYFRDTVGTNHALLGVFSDGANNDIYDMSTGTKSLQDDTKDLKTRFCTFLDSIVRVNGTDACKSFNGTAWATTAGAFDVANMPKGTVVIEWRDQVYTAGVSTSPSILYYSGIADPTARTISWTVGNGQIEIEQEDGGGAITALEKVPGYLLIFKERTLKRWDGNSTYPEDLINVGTPTQEAVCRGLGAVLFGNQEGVWVTNGSYPQMISESIQDLWDAIPAANISSIATYCDGRYAYIYVGDISLDGNDYTNILFRFNLKKYLSSGTECWDIFSYYSDFTVFTWYISSSSKVIVAGDKNGQAIQLNTGYTDYHSTVQPITYSLETQDIEFGTRGKLKEIIAMNVFSKNMTLGQLMYRANSSKDEDWKIINNLKQDIEETADFKIKGNYFNFKITGITDSGQVKIIGFEIPEQSIDIKQNAKE